VVPAGWARINYVRELPDGRRFVNDSRGLLYVLDRNNRPSVYANVDGDPPLDDRRWNRIAGNRPVLRVERSNGAEGGGD